MVCANRAGTRLLSSGREAARNPDITMYCDRTSRRVLTLFFNRALPLSVLRESVERWVQSELAHHQKGASNPTRTRASH
jgi:hypothetical protein